MQMVAYQIYAYIPHFCCKGNFQLTHLYFSLKFKKAQYVTNKYSGILTEVGENYKKEQILPYIDYIFEIFSTKKIMWGSDWPVLTMAENYLTWFDIAFDFSQSLSKDEKDNVFSKTATNFYKL